MYCHKCGSQIANDARFCPNCGQSLPGSSVAAASVAAPWTAPSGIRAQPGHWISAGFSLVSADFGSYLLIAIVFALLSGVPFIQGAMIAGFHIYTLKRLVGARAEFGDLFKGFNFFIPALVASLLIGLLVFAGTLALIIPGLIIAAMYKFTFLFIVDKKMDFWPAMQASHAVVRNDYVGFTLFLILAFLVNVLGFCCLIVGLLVTVPATIAAITIAYKELVGVDRAAVEAL